jgi:hypothetical protein
MRYIISALSLLLLVVIFDIPALVNKGAMLGNYSVMAAVSPTPTPEITFDSSSSSSAESSSSSDLSPTPISQDSTTSNTNQGNTTEGSQVIIPHPSVPIVITPFVDTSNKVIEKYYNPFSPTGIIELFNPHNFYTESIYAPYIKLILILFSLILFFGGVQLIDKSKITFLQYFRNRLFIKKERDKQLLQSYYEE